MSFLFNDDIKIGLALGGGGARGLAHIGVLKVFETKSIPISLIVGTSIGAVVGASYALNPDAKTLIEKMKYILSHHGLFKLENFFTSDSDDKPVKGIRKVANFLSEIYLMRLKSSRTSYVNSDLMEAFVDELVGDSNFEDTKIPFITVATDMISGEKVVLGHGPLKPAVLASAAIAGAFPPVELYGKTLADGSIIAPIPAKIARDLNMDIVIAVDVGKEIPIRKNVKTIAEACLQAEYITANHLKRHKLLDADIIIEPEVGHISWAHFSKGGMCVRRGVQAAEKKISEIRLAIHRSQRKKGFSKIIKMGKKLLRSKT